ncbi:hypothetical protein FISHEDRAFT_55407 [Fistulina hepatica ATCC 64428]|uniref:BTB domain-containing protein n=1 Tax=Fistulina hepatica ATCC 64428 TaxID=1128425 RepID=A0A0D7AMS0_9AGAR|nr:hypothetical protein FISHEDRAFT_55407 [Fistulina hepatica ATCC 64428]
MCRGLYKQGPDEYLASGVKSTLVLSKKVFSGTDKTDFSPVCGLGWRVFATVKLDIDEDTIHGTADTADDQRVPHLILYFDPYNLTGALRLGPLIVTTDFSQIASVVRAPISNSFEFSLEGPSIIGSFRLAPCSLDILRLAGASQNWIGAEDLGLIGLTVSLASRAELVLPQTIQQPMQRFILQSIRGKEVNDVQFLLPVLRNFRVFNLRPVYANSDAIRGFSVHIDNLLPGSGYNESHTKPFSAYLEESGPSDSDYDYQSDSDLDEDDVEVESSVGPRVPSDETSQTVGSTISSGWSIRIDDTAARTWTALLFYLYTGRIQFNAIGARPSRTASIDHVGAAPCSPKSMYRLANKIGMERLKRMAVEAIENNLTLENIVEELFSYFTSLHAEVMEIEASFLVRHIKESSQSKLTDDLSAKVTSIATDKLSHAGTALNLVISKLSIASASVSQ